MSLSRTFSDNISYRMPERFPEFAERLKGAMKSSGISGGELAGRLDVRPQTVSAWRNGDYRPEGERLDELAEQLGVSPAWLAFGEEGATPTDPTPRRAIRDDEYYDGILHSLSTFNRAAGQLLAEVQQWRDSKRAKKVADRPVPKTREDLQEAVDDSIAADEILDRIEEQQRLKQKPTSDRKGQKRKIS